MVSFSSQAYGVSADGSVGVWESSSNGSEAYRWTQAGGVVDLGDLAGRAFRSSALVTNADGSAVVGLGKSASGIEAIRWTKTVGMQRVV